MKVQSLELKMEVLKKQTCCLETTITEDKLQIEHLEKQFNGFLKDKEDLKQIAKCKDTKCRQSCEENKKLARENDIFRKELEKIKDCNILFQSELKSIEDERETLNSKMGNLNCIINQLQNEKERLMNEMVALNQENRNLLKTVDCLKKRIDHTRKLTQDEIIQLNTTIDELHCNLQRTKELQEQEEERYREIIAKLSRTIEGLSGELKEIEDKFVKSAKVCKICKGRAKVQFSENAEVQACCDESTCPMEIIQSKDEIIKVQCNTLNILQLELQALKKKDSQLRMDHENKYHEIQVLRQRVCELESALDDCDKKAENTQLAVDIYLNTINVLEASEEKYKIEIDQQKSTISNLQSALVATKQELDDIRQKSEENEQEQHGLINSLNVFMSEAEHEKENLVKQCECITDEYEHLQDLNFDLEVEHCDSLQDVHLLENQLFKYQTLFNSSEKQNVEYKCHLKKLLKQKKCYEEVIAYFKHEMTSMSEQLINLQDLMTLSNESTQEETCKLMQALVNVQSLNEKLSTQLIAAEQKVALENQMNLLQEAKIGELQELISDKEIDLTRHDHAIMNIRQSLKCSLKQNEELRCTINGLNETIDQLHNAVNIYEMENCKSKEKTQRCQEQITACMDKLDDLKAALEKKTEDLMKLGAAYTSQNRHLKSTQKELKEIQCKQAENRCTMKCTIVELEQKLKKSEDSYGTICKELSKVQCQMACLTKKEATKEIELKRYRKIVCELKQTLIDLNRSLTNRDVQKAVCRNEECRRMMELHGDHGICLNCPCEVEFYQNIVDTLKRSVIDLKRKLTDTQKRNQHLEEESRQKENMLEELSVCQSQRDKEYHELRQKLKEKLKQAQRDEVRYQEMAKQFQCELETIREELEVKTLQLDDVKKGALEINSSRCVQLACAQEEVNALKEDLNNILRKHCAINAENERLHCHGACMQSTVCELEEKSQLLKGQLEHYLTELQVVQNEKDALARKNSELLSELRGLKYACGENSKETRYTNESIKLIESEFIDLRNSRDDICSESKNVITYVCAWLQEQKKLNEHTARRERNYCNTIQRIKQDYEGIQCMYAVKPPKVTRFLTPDEISPTLASGAPWSLGSQGTANDPEAASRSPSPNQQSDWYSENFKNDSDEDEDEDWVSKVENLAAQVRKTNKMWKNKMGHNSDYMVSKDTKK